MNLYLFLTNKFKLYVKDKLLNEVLTNLKKCDISKYGLRFSETKKTIVKLNDSPFTKQIENTLLTTELNSITFLNRKCTSNFR